MKKEPGIGGGKSIFFNMITNLIYTYKNSSLYNLFTMLGYNERGDVEYKTKDEESDEYDVFGRKKKTLEK